LLDISLSEKDRKHTLFRKFIALSAAALAIGAVSVSPLVAQAAVNQATARISAYVPASAVITTSDVTLASWDHGVTETLPVTVSTTDHNNLSFTLSDTNGNGSIFRLWGPTGGYVNYNITDPNSNNVSNGGTTGSFNYSYAAYNFNVVLPDPGALSLVSDTYSDAVTIAVNLQ
jgi:hypothetical protein